ncbi:MAG: NAD-dependent deacylase [Pseudomonadota bacterium]
MNDSAALPSGLTRALREARKVFVLTGAGVSAESGIPTFREAQTGLWEKFDPLQLATPEAFMNDPALVWRWYRWRRELVAKAEPNAGHVALTALETHFETFTLVTQNVDGLHARAGSRDIVEFHGNLFVDRCFSCHTAGDAGDAELPTCKLCGGLLRPGVVWFGESIPDEASQKAVDAARHCDLMLCIGTSSTVFPAAALADLAHQSGAVTVEINPDPTGSPLYELVLPYPSGLILPKLVAFLEKSRP